MELRLGEAASDADKKLRWTVGLKGEIGRESTWCGNGEGIG